MGIVRQLQATKVFWRSLLLLLVLVSPWIGYNEIAAYISAETIISADWQSGDVTYSARLVEDHRYYLELDAKKSSPQNISVLIVESDTHKTLLERSYVRKSASHYTVSGYGIHWTYEGDEEFVCSETALYEIAIYASTAEGSYSFELRSFAQDKPTGLALFWFPLMWAVPWFILEQMRKYHITVRRWDIAFAVLVFVEGLAGFILSLVLS